MRPPHNSAEDRQFDSRMAASDPARIDAAREASVAEEFRARWDRTTAARRRRLTTYRRCAAASLLVAALAGFASVPAMRFGQQFTSRSTAPARRPEPSPAPQPPAAASLTEPTVAADIASQRAAPQPAAEPPYHARTAPQAHGQAAAASEAASWAAAIAEWSSRLDRLAGAAAMNGQRASDFPDRRTLQRNREWLQVVAELRAASPGEQRVLVALTPHFARPAQRVTAVQLVAEAGQTTAIPVLEYWLMDVSLHDAAYAQLCELVADSELPKLAAAARTDADREVFCRQLVLRRPLESQLKMLLTLAPHSPWQAPVHRAASELPATAVEALLAQLSEGDTERRAAAAFLVSAMRQERVDQVLVERVLSGRSRHAAYLALLARPTDEAKLFLATAARRWDLSPGLRAAHYGWSRVRPLTERWSQQLRGVDDAQQPEQTSAGGSATRSQLALVHPLRSLPSHARRGST